MFVGIELGVVKIHAAEKPQDYQHDNDDTENASKPGAAIAIVAVVTATAAEEQHNQDNEKYCSHYAPLFRA